jgi:signal-transduction protein with cAMP-binding, CBS, and nucleotidyltransferase domain
VALPIFVALFVFRVAIVSQSDPVYVAAKKMREFRVNSVVIMTGNKIQGILTYYSFLCRIFLLWYSIFWGIRCL